MPSNPFAEIVDTLFNGRPAPKEAKVIRVRLTAKQVAQLVDGAALQFSAEGTTVLVTFKSF